MQQITGKIMNAATSPALQLEFSGVYSEQGLRQLFDKVNRHHFDNRIHADIRWEIPAGHITLASAGRPTLPPDSAAHQEFARARSLLARNHYRQALPLLIRCADAGHLEGHLLLNHLLKRLNDERWPDYVKRYNQRLHAQRAVPAACYYPDARAIAIHPYMRERKAPQFVLKYLIYHECCHQLVECDPMAPHPPTFMALEQQAPGREKALAWLTREGFPTLAGPASST